MRQSLCPAARNGPSCGVATTLIHSCWQFAKLLLFPRGLLYSSRSFRPANSRLTARPRPRLLTTQEDFVVTQKERVSGESNSQELRVC